jgi:predicted metal-dependent phosphoesterase TrpH
MVRVDLHSHTKYSRDGHSSPESLVRAARAAGLDRIAVTDHGTIEGALRARDLDPDLVIVGEEIRCRCRTELIGLFLHEAVPQRLPLEETVSRIREQGGVIYAPHPYAYARRALTRARRALDAADVVEAVNARAFLPPWNRAATRAAEARGIPIAAGSDAHFAFEIGRAFAEMPAFDDAEGLLEALPGSRPIQRARSGPGLHVASFGLKCVRMAAAGLAPRNAEAWGSRRVATAD